jgi:NAD+ synthase (glutamine-hydrolysing)
VGYNTMDGDTSGGLAPIAGVNKDWLLDWLKWAEENLQLPGLAGVNAQQPTAELRPQAMGQTDEADLMPFHILTRIEEVALRQYQPPVAVFQTLRGIAPDLELAAYIRRFFTLWARNQWKRERFAPSFHLDEHSLDPRTWYRFPILSGGFRKELHELDMYLAALLGDAGTDQNA